MQRRNLATAWLLGLLALVWLAPAAWADVRRGYEPVAGDVVFQSLPHNPLVDAIEGASGSPYSHCGIVATKEDAFVVVEAIGAVIETDLDEWLRRGRQQGFAVYRFEEKYRDRCAPVVAACRKQLGKPYDFRYEFDDEKLYCSELIYKAFREVTDEPLGKVRKLGELNWQPYELVIRLLDDGGLPLDREMISPKDLAEAAQLRLVLRKGI